jgi:hypothetical protein
MRTRFEQWRHAHADSHYPFEDGCELVTLSGQVLPIGVFLDASLYPVGNVDGLQIQSISISVDTVRIFIGVLDDPQLCVTEFSLLSPPEELTVRDVFGREAGVLVAEPLLLSGLQAWGVGTHIFPEGAARFVASAVIPLPHTGVYGVVLDDNSVLIGDVWLVGEDGITLSCGYEDVEVVCGVTERRYVIRVDAVGDPLFKRKLCEPDRFETPRMLQKLVFQKGGVTHSCTPENGNIKIGVGSLNNEETILRIQPTETGLMVKAVGEKLETPNNA